MAVALLECNNVGDSSNNHLANSIPLSGGSNRVLVVIVAWSGSVAPTSGTYNSVSLSEVFGVNWLVGGYTYYRIFYLINPDPGINLLDIIFDGYFDNAVMHWYHFSGVDQTFPFGNEGPSSGGEYTFNTGAGGSSLTMNEPSYATEAILHWCVVASNGNMPDVININYGVERLGNTFSDSAASQTCLFVSWTRIEPDQTIGLNNIEASFVDGFGAVSPDNSSMLALTLFPAGTFSSPSRMVQTIMIM